MTEGIHEEELHGPSGLGGTERVLRVGGDSPIRISTGHRILHHDGKCSRPHGHNYEFSIENPR